MANAMALLGPIMEYACVTWDPFTHRNIRKLEMIPRKAADVSVAEFRTTGSVTKVMEGFFFRRLTKEGKTPKLYYSIKSYELRVK